jgi:hypothetical protein
VQESSRHTAIRAIVVNAMPFADLITASNATVISPANAEALNYLALFESWTREDVFSHGF